MQNPMKLQIVLKKLLSNLYLPMHLWPFQLKQHIDDQLFFVLHPVTSLWLLCMRVVHMQGALQVGQAQTSPATSPRARSRPRTWGTGLTISKLSAHCMAPFGSSCMVGER